MRAIATGMIATYPVGGVAWDYGQYLVGLEQLGFEVYYLEDTGGSTYDPRHRRYGEDSTYAVEFLRSSLTQLSPGLANRWHFRNAAGAPFGMSLDAFQEVVAGADLFLNVSGGTLLRDEYMGCPCKVLIDTDPGWNHFVNYPRWDASPGWQGSHGFRGHDHYFTYAERLGCADCPLPDFGLPWRPTRPPVVLDRWQPGRAADRWTTVMTWNNFQKPVEFAGRAYGTKECEFAKIEAIPALHPSRSFELATGGSGPPVAKLSEIGWHIVDSHAVSRTMDNYRQYIESSRGELSVAKNLYVATRSGWFSCRTACYLAAGRPAVVQDTGFSEFVPTGEGLLAFDDEAGASRALDAVELEYERHSAAARTLAAEYLDARRVLGTMLRKIGLG
jgi:hypothetical protein